MATIMFPDITVNSTPIAQADIAAEAQNHNAPASKPGWACKAAARALTVRALLRPEAARRDLAPEPQDLGAGRFETEEEATIRLLLEQEIAADAPTEAEMRAWRPKTAPAGRAARAGVSGNLRSATRRRNSRRR